MNARRFQFSLSRMLLAVTYFSMSCATLGRALEIWRTIDYSFSAVDTIAITVVPFAFAGLLGAAVGTLFNRTLDGAKLGVQYLIQFIFMIVVDAILIGAALWFWCTVSM